ncbi:MAG: hypothetical protein IPJ88_05990 [Myxococcales bacterium]|nr:MAG: hypothetical protein IPJ88_05990 [Myxococcales bacterium]
MFAAYKIGISVSALALILGLIACGQTQIVGVDPGDTEVCDGLDNDGDTRTDEADPLNGQSCGEATDCTVSVYRCDNGRGMVCRTENFEEVCDKEDNDCDNRVDEGLLCGIDFPPPSDSGLPFFN